MNELLKVNTKLPPGYITAKEAALRYGCTPEYIARLCRTGSIEGRFEGRIWLVSEKGLATFAAKRGKGATTRTKRLSIERKREYQVSKDREGLYRALFESIATLPRPAVSTVPKTRVPRRKNGVAARAFAAAVAALVVFGNYGLVVGYGEELQLNAFAALESLRSVDMGAVGAGVNRVAVKAVASVAASAPQETVSTVSKLYWEAVHTTRSIFSDEKELNHILARPKALAQEEGSTVSASTTNAHFQTLITETVHAKKVCIGAICLDEDKLSEITGTAQ